MYGVERPLTVVLQNMQSRHDGPTHIIQSALNRSDFDMIRPSDGQVNDQVEVQLILGWAILSVR